MATLSPPLPQAGPDSLTPPAVRLRVALVVGLCCLTACLPLVLAHGFQLWLRPHYQFFPLLLVGALVLAWSALRTAPLPSPDSPLLGAGLAGLTWLLLAVAILLDSSWLGAVAFQSAFAAVAVGLGGLVLLRRLLPSWVLLWLAVPPPFEYDRTVILFLQTLTTRLCSSLLDLFGVFHAVSGHLFEVNGRLLLVEQACGGINSLLSVLACTLFFVFFARRPPVRAALLLVAALFWVLTANVARVVLVVLLAVRWNIDLTTGIRHDALGLALFALALGLLWSTDRFLALLLSPVWKTPTPAPQDPARAESAPTWTWLTSWPFGVAFALLLGIQLSGFAAASNPFVHGPTLPALGRLSEETLPLVLDKDCSRTAYTERTRDLGSEFGERSSLWTYRLRAREVILSLDHPFPGWHDLTRCYTTQGWVIQAENPFRTATPEGEPAGFVEVRMARPGYRVGYLLYGQFDGRGTILDPRASGADLTYHRFLARADRWLGRGSVAATDPPGPIYQFQLFAEGFTPLAADEEEQARRVFLAAARELRH